MMAHEMYSAEQVAALLGLHVKTVRAWLREGRLKAVRIGKQYRIAREDLEALTGPLAPSSVRRTRHVEVSSVVSADAVSRETADRATTMLTSAVKGRPQSDAGVRIDTSYDEERARFKAIVTGSLETSAVLLNMLDAILKDRP